MHHKENIFTEQAIDGQQEKHFLAWSDTRLRRMQKQREIHKYRHDDHAKKTVFFH